MEPAAEIARRSDGQLRLVLVHEPPPIPLDLRPSKTGVSLDLAARKAERAYLRGVRARLREDGVRVASAVTLTGRAGPALVAYADNIDPDLVVMATHGRGGLSRLWLGSTADHLVRHLEIPILLVRPGTAVARWAPAGSDRVLVPLDGSALAEVALAPAVELARLWSAELRLLRVIEPIIAGDPMHPIAAVYDQELAGRLRDAAQEYLDKVIARLEGQGVRVTGTAVIGGTVADTILEAAQGGRVSALAIATHGRGGLRRAMLGSVADKLVRGAEVPVLVLRPAGRRAPKTARGPRRRAGAFARSNGG